ncbi:MAG: DUF2442 domain-containing protein [Chitinophagales bacterium]|nr:DUF2442 domain-containing protein [Chitinophagales bacterium]
MNSSAKIVNKKSSDPLDKLIYEKGLRASYLVIDKKLDLLLVVLNNGKVLRDKISPYTRLKNASQKQLENYELIGRGSGIHWPALDEDLSIKGMIKSTALDQAISMLQEKEKV